MYSFTWSSRFSSPFPYSRIKWTSVFIHPCVILMGSFLILCLVFFSWTKVFLIVLISLIWQFFWPRDQFSTHQTVVKFLFCGNHWAGGGKGTFPPFFMQYCRSAKWDVMCRLLRSCTQTLATVHEVAFTSLLLWMERLRLSEFQHFSESPQVLQLTSGRTQLCLTPRPASFPLDNPYAICSIVNGNPGKKWWLENEPEKLSVLVTSEDIS